jgi:hypothetical protein
VREWKEISEMLWVVSLLELINRIICVQYTTTRCNRAVVDKKMRNNRDLDMYISFLI